MFTELCPFSMHTPWNGTGPSTYLEVLTGTSKRTCSCKCWTMRTRRATRSLAVSLLYCGTAQLHVVCVLTSTASSMNTNAPAGDTASLWAMKWLQPWLLILSSTTSQRQFPEYVPRPPHGWSSISPPPVRPNTAGLGGIVFTNLCLHWLTDKSWHNVAWNC